MDQYIGKMLDNRYEILERIGTGGMAIVYKAKCHRLNRLVAIKILKSDLAQPGGAATPRNSDAHKRIAVPKALCVLRECPRPRPKSGKVRRSDTRPGDVRERAERSEGSDTTPHPKRPVFRRVCPCVRFFSESRVCTRFHS